MIQRTTDINQRAADIADRQADKEWERIMRANPESCPFYETFWLATYNQVMMEFRPALSELSV